ncbi:MAG: hypothetical protein JWL64_1558 [Frankiales bacterium]|nr:hypothetical protein [Frankiales bacterium]
MDSAELRTRVGVTELMARYQFLTDSGKIRQVSELFLPDAVFENNRGQVIGPQGVLDFFMSTKDAFLAADFLPARHHLSSIHVDVRPDGSASTYACFQFLSTRGLDHWGTYRDVVVEADGGWKFASRQATVEGSVAGSPIAAMLGLEPTA